MINVQNNVNAEVTNRVDTNEAAIINTARTLGDGVDQCTCTWSPSLNKMIPGCNTCSG